MATSRRKVLVFFLIGAAMSAGVSRLLRNRPVPLDTRPIRNLPGFRYVSGGAASGGGVDPFIGLGATEASPEGSLDDLFATPAPPGTVPVAVFSDYKCPYCRVLTKLITEEAAAGGIAVTWHELPLLGTSSLLGAKAALAAGLQGAYLPMHQRLMGSSFRPSETWLRGAAAELGLDADRLLRDMEGPEVAARLRASAGLASLFGIHGTPALVVGRTLVIGDVTRRDLRRIIEMERG